MTDKKIYQTPAYNKSPRDAATEFALTYWEAPRHIEYWEQLGTLEAKFTVFDGSNVYRVYFQRGVKSQTVDLYIIEREISVLDIVSLSGPSQEKPMPYDMSKQQPQPQDKNRTLDNLIFLGGYKIIAERKGLAAVEKLIRLKNPSIADLLLARLKELGFK